MRLLAWLWTVPGLSPLAAAMACAAPALLLKDAAPPAWLAFFGLLAATALARLLGTWCADPVLGASLAAAGMLAGIAAQSRATRPDEDDALSWAVGAGVAFALLPFLLRFLGLNAARAGSLDDPLSSGAFILGQACLLAALAAGATAFAARGLARPSSRAARALPALAAVAAAAAATRPGASSLLAWTGAAMSVACALHLRPWRRWRSDPMRVRAQIVAAALALTLAAVSADTMRDVWSARLDAVYPGGKFLSFIDDGIRIRGVYQFSTQGKTVLRDGVLQVDDAAAQLALMALHGQRVRLESVLVIDPPTPTAPAFAAALGLSVRLEEGSLAQTATLDAIGPSGWRAGLKPPARATALDGAVLFLPAPPTARGLTAAPRLRSLRAALVADGCAAVLVPVSSAKAVISRIEGSVREVFGFARTADAGRSVLIIGCPQKVETDPSFIYGMLPTSLQMAELHGDKTLSEKLRWR